METIDTDVRRREREVQSRAVLEAVREAVREALLDHKRAGNPVCYWDGQQVQWLPPEKIGENWDN